MSGHFRRGSTSVSGKLPVVQGLRSPTWLLHKSLFDSFTAHYSSCRECRVSSSTSGAELEGEGLRLRMRPEKLLGSLARPRPPPGSFLGGSIPLSGASGIPSASLSESLVLRVSPKGLCFYGAIIYGLKPGSRWCFYIDHTGWIPARDLGLLFVFTCSLSDGNVNAGPPWS